jgi:hypothetical protein
MRTTDPVDGSDLPEAAIWKRAWELFEMYLRQENITRSRPGFPWDFERLCHAAFNFQI